MDEEGRTSGERENKPLRRIIRAWVKDGLGRENIRRRVGIQVGIREENLRRTIRARMKDG